MPQHLTTPVLEKVDPAFSLPKECEKLKKKYKVTTGRYKNKPKIAKVSGRQKHHIMQHAAIKIKSGASLLSKAAGFCINLLGGSHVPGSEHSIANRLQAQRRMEKFKKLMPTISLGLLKQLSRNDLLESFRQSGMKEGRHKDFKKLADCLVREAEKFMHLDRKRAKKTPTRVHNNQSMQHQKGCFAAGTLVWVGETQQVAIEDLCVGVEINTRAGHKTVIRTERCISVLVEIEVEGSRVAMAPFHRVRLAHGRYLSACALLPGHVVITANGPMPIRKIERIEGFCSIFSFGVGERAECQIGPCGLWVEIPDSGPRISDHVEISTKFSNSELTRS